MAQFSGMVLTKQGLQLQARAQTGAALQFSKVKLGDGTLSSGQSLDTMTDLISIKLSLAIQSMDVIGDGTSRVRVALTNDGLETGFFVREIGVYAYDTSAKADVLYSVSNAGDMADFLPAGGAETVVEQIIDLITVVGNAQNVTAVIDRHTMLATLEDFGDLKANLKSNDADKGASTVGIADTKSNFIGTTVEAALSELGSDTLRYKEIATTDLNKIKDLGLYSIAGNNNNVNFPAIKATDGIDPKIFWTHLEVLRGPYPIQRLTYFYQGGGTNSDNNYGLINRVYQRVNLNLSSDSWSNWRAID